MRRILSLIALSFALPACIGPQSLATPDLAHPGTEERQQARAKRFEPYPEIDMGPPVVGAGRESIKNLGPLLHNSRTIFRIASRGRDQAVPF